MSHPEQSTQDQEREALEQEFLSDEVESEEEASGASQIRREIFSWVITIATAILAAIVIQNFVIVNAAVPTGSMLDTIQEGDRVVAFRLSYLFSEPQYGDIVIFRFPDDESELYVKRVIGTPGDVVEIVDGLVYLNGSEEPLPQPYVTRSATGDYGPYVVPEGEYFMLGDNRDNSSDSRKWQDTYVSEDQILGKVFFRYYPDLHWFPNDMLE